MTTALQRMTEQASWAIKNTAYNLDFIPDEKFDWKPAETAKSALEVINHMLGSVQWTKGAILNKKLEAEPVKTKAEAKAALKEAEKDFETFLTGLTEDDLAKIVTMPWGEMPADFMVNLGVVDMIHHRGHICYIQTLLGDTDDHFEM